MPDLPKAYNGCTCSCHVMRGVHHIAPCCYPVDVAAVPTPLNEKDVLSIAQDVLRGYGHDAIADALEGYQKPAPVTFHDGGHQVSLWRGPFHGATPTLPKQPAHIEISGKYVYVRVDDPDTGQSLNFYAFKDS